MTEEETIEETIKNFKRIVANYSSYPNYEIFYDRLKSSGIKGSIKNTMVDMIDFMENLQKEITNDRLREENLKNILMEIIETLNLENNVISQETILQEIIRLQTENEELKNKVIKRDNDIIYLEETAEKEFLTKIEVKANYIPKDKIRELFKKYNINISEEEITVDGLDALTFIEEIDELLEEE